MAQDFSGLFKGPSYNQVGQTMASERDARIRQAMADNVGAGGNYYSSLVAKAAQQQAEALRGIAPSVAGAFGMDIQDPRLAKAAKREQDRLKYLEMFKDYGKDGLTPDEYDAIANAMTADGYLEEAKEVLTRKQTEFGTKFQQTKEATRAGEAGRRLDLLSDRLAFDKKAQSFNETYKNKTLSLKERVQKFNELMEEKKLDLQIRKTDITEADLDRNWELAQQKLELRQQEFELKLDDHNFDKAVLSPLQQDLLRSQIARNEAAALKDGKAGGRKLQQAGVFLDGNGKYLGNGFVDLNTGETLLSKRDDEGNHYLAQAPKDAVSVNKSAIISDKMTPKQFSDLTQTIQQDISSINTLNNYTDMFKDMDSGLRLVVGKFLAEVKTAVGKDKLTEKELTTLQSSGVLQGLLGKFREDVVGGGVMTEQDALRVLSALGGDISATRNPEVAVRLLKSRIESRKKSLEWNIRHYNNQIRPIYGREGYPELKMPGQKTSPGESQGSSGVTDWNSMSDVVPVPEMEDF